MPHRRFTRLEEFIELARTGDIYQEQAENGLEIVTFRAKSHRSGHDHLRAERLTTSLVAKGVNSYAYRTRSRTGTLFNTRDRHGDPAFLGTSAQERFVSLVEVPYVHHSQALFVVHHTSIAKTHFGLHEQKVPA